MRWRQNWACWERSARRVLADKRVMFTLTTSESQDDIVAICSFVLDPDDLKISHGGAEIKPQSGDAGYEIFETEKDKVANQPPAAAEPAAVIAPPAETQNLGRRASDAAPGETKNLGRRATDKEATGQESSSIRVGVEKVDQLINLVGELVITQAMIEQRIGALDPMLHERLLNSASQLARNTRDLQEAVMSIRMMPMDYVFSRFPRMVRDLAGKLGKKVEFITRGAATELDKGLIERIVDPLTHLVRNSVDHGIEMPETAPRRRQERNRQTDPVGRASGRQHRDRGQRRWRWPESRHGFLPRPDSKACPSRTPCPTAKSGSSFLPPVFPLRKS